MVEYIFIIPFLLGIVFLINSIKKKRLLLLVAVIVLFSSSVLSYVTVQKMEKYEQWWNDFNKNIINKN